MEIVAGFLVSLAVQIIKQSAMIEEIGKYGTIVMAGVVSLCAAAIYVALVQVGYWETALKILMVAAGAHNLILRQFEKED